MFSHILIPIDGSPLSTIALEKALAFARDAEAKVTVLSVIQPFQNLASELDRPVETPDYERRAWEAAAVYLTDAELKAKALGVPCEIVKVQDEHPYRAIIHTAAERHCDLIAMASHGRGGLAAIVIGSETVKVLTHSTIPVMVYR